MAITDNDQLIEVQQRLVEADTTFASGLWTVVEIGALFNQRQNRFNRDTKILLALADPGIAVAAGAFIVPLPIDWFATQRMAWVDTATGVITPMRKSDRYAAAMGLQSIGQPSKPLLFDDVAGDTLTAEIFPTPTADGKVKLLYASVLEVMNFNGTNDIFDLPDEFVPYVTYGVLEDLLSKEGRGQDLARAAYCRERYEEGVALAAFLLNDFM